MTHHQPGADGAQPLRVAVSRTDETTTIALAGELDMGGTAAAERVLLDAEAGARAIVIDLDGLTFMDSSGVRLLVDAYRRSAAAEHAFALRHGGGPARRVLRLVRLDEVLPTIDSSGGAA